MALNYTFCNKDVVAPADSQDGFGMVFRKTIDCGKNNLATSTNYAIARLPKGFAPRIACAYVDEEISASSVNVTVNVGTESSPNTDGTSGNLAVYQTGNIAGATCGVTGTVSSSTATIVQKVITGDSDFVSFTVSGACSKGKLTITLCGDQLLTPAKAF